MRPQENGANMKGRTINALSSDIAGYISNVFSLVQEKAAKYGIDIYKEGKLEINYSQETIKAFAEDLLATEGWNTSQFLKTADRIDQINYFMLDLQNLPYADANGTILKPTFTILRHNSKAKRKTEQYTIQIGSELDGVLRLYVSNADNGEGLLPLPLCSLPSSIIFLIQDTFNMPGYGYLGTDMFLCLYLITNVIVLISAFLDKPDKEKTAENIIQHFPSGPMVTLMQKSTRYSNDYKRLEERASNNEKITVTQTAENTTIIRTKGNDGSNVAELQISRIVDGKHRAGAQIMQAGSDTYEKLLTLTLFEIENSMFSDKITDYKITFGLQDLVNYGLYKSIESARIGIEGCFHNFLKQLYVAGTLKIGKGKSEKSYGNKKVRTLFTGFDITSNNVTILLNHDIDWNFIAPFHTIMPPSIYLKLPIRASRLFNDIFNMARQNTDKLKKDHFFIVTFETIRDWLALPDNVTIDENGQKKKGNPGRDIKKPIMDAVAEIMAKWKEEYPQEETPGLELELQCDEKLPIAEYMKTGRLKVTLSGQYLAYFINLEDNKTAKIEERRKQLAAAKEKKETAKNHS